ncbi:MAG: non-canonical purine NTP pyrophosphatase [Candidatus Odinarchaeota archaeon]
MNDPRDSIELIFSTSNANKFSEAEEFLKKATLPVKLINHRHSRVEIQAETLEEVALYSLENDPALRNRYSTFVEDAGLFIDILDGFPGPYSAHALKKLHCQGILKLMAGVEDRSARFESAIAFRDVAGNVHLFKGVTSGTMAFEERGTHWGFDPIFIPAGDSRTYAELGEDKEKFNHRIKSISKLVAFLKERYSI